MSACSSSKVWVWPASLSFWNFCSASFSSANNPEILRPFIQAVIDAQVAGIPVSSERIRDLEIYLDELGGIYILDCLPEQKIHDRILKKAENLAEKDKKVAGARNLDKRQSN